jgi:hypothetical protein
VRSALLPDMPPSFLGRPSFLRLFPNLSHTTSNTSVKWCLHV